MLPNRVALYFLCFAGAAGAAVPALANFDTSSVVGWVGGLAAIATGVGIFLYNWGKYEERTALEGIVADQVAQDRGTPPGLDPDGPGRPVV